MSNGWSDIAKTSKSPWPNRSVFSGEGLKELYQSGCAKLMLPKTYGKMTEAVLLNTAGGITGGDS